MRSLMLAASLLALTPFLAGAADRAPAPGPVAPPTATAPDWLGAFLAGQSAAKAAPGSDEAEPPAPAAPTTAITEEATTLSVMIDGKPYALEAMVVRPTNAPGRLPVAVLTHGTAPGDNPSVIRASLMRGQARDLALRGWLAVAVVRRGYGLSDGEVAGITAPTCAAVNYREGFDADAREIEAAIGAILARPDADPTRVIAIGQSAGGAAVLALAARALPGLVAVVNVSGGLQIIQNTGEHCPNDDKLVATMREIGREARVPSLWIYAQNDSLFRPALARRMREAFVDGKGREAPAPRADFRMFNALGINGHFIFETPEGRLHWLPELDAFLASLDLPSAMADRLEAALAAGKIAPDLRGLVKFYLAAPSNKFLAVSASGRGLRMRFGFETEQRHKIRGLVLQECEQVSKGEPCHILMENFDLLAPAMPTAGTEPSPMPS